MMSSAGILFIRVGAPSTSHLSGTGSWPDVHPCLEQQQEESQGQPGHQEMTLRHPCSQQNSLWQGKEG